MKMVASNDSQKSSQDIKNEYVCQFCDKVYTLKASYQSHMRKTHTDLSQSAKKNKRIKMTKALDNLKINCLFNVSKILEEVKRTIIQNTEEKTYI